MGIKHPSAVFTPAALSAAFLAVSVPALAAPVEVSTSYTQFDDSVSGSDSAAGTGLQEAEVQYYGGGNNVGADSRADNEAGAIAVRANGIGGSFESEATALLRSSYSNESSAAQRVFLDFAVEGGLIGADGSGNAASDGWARNSYEVAVSAGEASWQTGVSVTQQDDGSDSEVTLTGADLGGEAGGWGDSTNYSWNDQEHSLDLGILDAGETVSVEYFVRMIAEGENLLFDDYGYGGDAGGSIGDFGDPFGFNSLTLMSDESFRTETLASVPEPGTGALIGAGLLALGWKRRQRARQSAA